MTSPAGPDEAGDPGALLRRTPWKPVVALAVACALIAGVVAYLVAPGSASNRAATGPGAGLAIAATGRPAPTFDLRRLGGGTPVRLAADHGHPVVINFFASWCPECRAELRAFARASSRAGTVRFIGIDTEDSSPRQAERLLAAAGVHYPVGIDSSAAVANQDYLVQALPATIFISRDGKIAGHAYGAQTLSTLQAWMSRLSGGGTGHGTH